MKKLLMVCCLLVSMVSLSKAQGRMRMSPADQAKQLQAQLKLTDDQTTKITAILQAQSTKMDSLRTANSGGDRQAMMAAMQPIRKATTEKIAAVLTDEQKVAYKKWEEERMSRMRNGGGPGQGGGNPPPPQK